MRTIIIKTEEKTNDKGMPCWHITLQIPGCKRKEVLETAAYQTIGIIGDMIQSNLNTRGNHA